MNKIPHWAPVKRCRQRADKPTASELTASVSPGTKIRAGRVAHSGLPKELQAHHPSPLRLQAQASGIHFTGQTRGKDTHISGRILATACKSSCASLDMDRERARVLPSFCTFETWRRNGGMSMTRNEGQSLKGNLGCKLCSNTISGLTTIHQFGLKLLLTKLQPQKYYETEFPYFHHTFSQPIGSN